MNVERFKSEDVKRLVRKRKVVTMSELKKALGTCVDMTVFRKLKQLGYRTSYSHGSRYYTLNDVVRFDEDGLWDCQGVRFSRDGTLLATLERWVNRSQAGHVARELEELLQVSVKESLLRLVTKGQLVRESIGGVYLYCSTNTAIRRKQVRARERRERAQQAAHVVVGPEQLSDEAKAAIILFLSILDEKQKRLYAGVESLKLGAGGDRQIADLLSLHPHTVAAGRRELRAHDVEIDRTRRAGGGRKPVKKKRRR